MKSFLPGLRSGIPQLGLCVMYPSPGVIERIGPDWDWMWIDGQHGELGYQDVLALVRACDLVQRASLVRVPGHDFGAIGLALDTGADGVIVPLVDNADEARRIVAAAKFPPLGGRSFGGRRPIDLRGRAYCGTANEDTLLVVQIESPEALANADAIAATPGVDALFLGPDDVRLRRGLDMSAAQANEADMERVIQACRKRGKFAATVGIGPDNLRRCAGMGFNMIVGGGDVGFLSGGSRAASTEAREIVKRCAATGSAAAAPASSPY